MEPPYRPSFATRKRKFRDGESDNDEEEETTAPSVGFQGFVGSSTRLDSSSLLAGSTGAMNQPSWKNGAGANGSKSKGKSTPTMGSNSFAARMMAKMGYVEGQGLGSGGQGILNPVESVLRPQGVGLGSVREKSKQAKDEAKREAERRGEVLETSSDEERKRRKRRQQRQREGGKGSGSSTPRGPPKPRYRTAREMEEDAMGLEVPNVLKSLVDATGKEQKLLTSTAGLMGTMSFVNSEQGETWKIARRARLDLEAFVDEWKGLNERKEAVEAEESHIVGEIDKMVANTEKIQALTSTIEELDQLSLNDDLDTRWNTTTMKLEALGTKYQDSIDEFRLSDVAVAAVHPLLRNSMEDWEPLSNPSYLTSYFGRLQHLLLYHKMSKNDTFTNRRSTSTYETLIQSIWLPKIRSTFLNDWDVYDPSPAISVVEAWKTFLPEFILSNILNQVIVPKLSSALKSWKPRSKKNGDKKSTSHTFPWWLFEWLRFLDESHTDPKAPTGLLSDAKRKFRSLLDTWNLSRGLPQEIELWKEILGPEFNKQLQNHLLPRLARHLREEFDVNPQDQDLSAFEAVMKWKPLFNRSEFGLLLCTEFFPKWHAILHLWLTSDPNYEEVGQWFSWWKTQVPEDVNAVSEVNHEWERGLHLMNQALDLGDKARMELSPLEPTQNKPDRPGLPGEKAPRDKVQSTTKTQIKHIEEPSFKDVVEEWCADEGLIIVPLREAHLQSGLPLFRITASANGKGGVLVYLKGDVVWAQNKRAKDIWEPTGLDNVLVSRAEGN